MWSPRRICVKPVPGAIQCGATRATCAPRTIRCGGSVSPLPGGLLKQVDVLYLESYLP